MAVDLKNWTVDYGDATGPRDIQVPHSWLGEVPVTWEGPAVYRTSFAAPDEDGWLFFQGVCYEARVFLNGKEALVHRGIWDSFSVPLRGLSGQVEVEVQVVKNGGATHPVADVVSGFLPYVFHTFGGIYKPVQVVETKVNPAAPRELVPSRVSVRGRKLFVDAKPFYLRGALMWGWYPAIGHPNPPEDLIVKEVEQAKRFGFNVIKFCLWLPPHSYLEALQKAGIFAWIELPLWAPSPDAAKLERMAEEVERIVGQYRHHDNVLLWTVGCELSSSTPAEFREKLQKRVKELTGSPLVTDNSGSCEMYGGDLREFGDFYDFHPYCDLPFYPQTLDSLLPTGRQAKPLLLGEFNDIDCHRDLDRLARANRYWCSPDPDLNDKGVRWQYDLPSVLATSRFTKGEASHERLLASSRDKALFIRKTVQEWVRMRDAISGYVITGWRDTPISSAGFVNDWEEPRFSREEVLHWNGPSVLYLIPSRRPPWMAGGNRPGWTDPFNHFREPIHLRIGVHGETSLSGKLEWDILQFNWHEGQRPRGRVASGTGSLLDVSALTATEVGEIYWEPPAAGGYFLRVSFCGVTNTWPIWVVERPDFSGSDWVRYDPADLIPELRVGEGDHMVATRIPTDFLERLRHGSKLLLFLQDEGTIERPFWRESAYEFLEKGFWTSLGMGQNWERFLPVSADRAIDPVWLNEVLRGANVQVLMNRVDVRTYEDAPIMVRGRLGNGEFLITTLRPFGGLGVNPISVSKNPSGAFLLKGLLRFRN